MNAPTEKDTAITVPSTSMNRPVLPPKPIRGEGVGSLFAGVQADLTEPAAPDRVVHAIEDALGPIDIFIHIAATACIGPMLSMPSEAWERAYRLHVDATLRFAQRLVPGMLSRRSGVFCAFLTAPVMPFISAYGSTKMALRALLDNLAAEVGPDAGVHIFGYVPGSVDTPFLHRAIGQLSALTGAPEEALVAQLSRNPGYPGLVPPEHSAVGLAFQVVNASSLHGQAADPFPQLWRTGISPQPLPSPVAAEPGSAAGPIGQFLADVTTINSNLELRIDRRTKELAEERAKSDALLHATLPNPVVPRLREGLVIADQRPDVAVLFADICGFTKLSSGLPPAVMVSALEQLFGSFDAMVDRHGAEKIKTIGDCYMAATGLFSEDPDHVSRIVELGLDMQRAAQAVPHPDGGAWQLRIGVHAGPVVAGVIGRRRFLYDLWGDTVNVASRMESCGVPGRVHVTDAVKLRLRRPVEQRSVDVKGVGLMQTWLVNDH